MKLGETALSFLACILLSLLPAFAQNPAQNSTTCTLADGKHLRVTYEPVSAKLDLKDGQVWAPGNQPMILFSEADLTLAGTSIPIGAYSLYLVPGQAAWTLIVNRQVTAGAPYSKADDLVRAPMPIGKLPSKGAHFQAYFAHVAPQQCNLRVDYGNTRAWVEIKEK